MVGVRKAPVTLVTVRLGVHRVGHFRLVQRVHGPYPPLINDTLPLSKVQTQHGVYVLAESAQGRLFGCCEGSPKDCWEETKENCCRPQTPKHSNPGAWSRKIFRDRLWVTLILSHRFAMYSRWRVHTAIALTRARLSHLHQNRLNPGEQISARL